MFFIDDPHNATSKKREFFNLFSDFQEDENEYSQAHEYSLG